VKNELQTMWKEVLVSSIRALFCAVTYFSAPFAFICTECNLILSMF
jgi:hypothetical protein